MATNKHLYHASAYAAFFESLVKGEATVRDLIADCGLAANTVRKLVHAMRRRRLIHVTAWEQDSAGRWTVPVYKLGSRADAPRPAPLTSTQRSANQRRRNRDAAIRNLGVPHARCVQSHGPRPM